VVVDQGIFIRHLYQQEHFLLVSMGNQEIIQIQTEEPQVEAAKHQVIAVVLAKFTWQRNEKY
jgi:hypothetical protein